MTPPDRDASGVGKRARLACLNCRHKKVRCSGRQPVCDLCSRLSQHCLYTARGERPAKAAGITGANRPSLALLGERMDKIEGKLEGIMDMLTTKRNAPSVSDIVSSPVSSTGSVREADCEFERSVSFPALTLAPVAATVPPLELLLTVADVYFKYYHNQPYALFHEQSFREKLSKGILPTHLIFAFLASAIRFIPDTGLFGSKFQTMDEYAAHSWKSVILPWNGLEHAAEVSTVQTILLLGVLDFTAGRYQSSWIKIGLGIRIAHHLQLMKEPPEHLPPVEREERRRLFWSLYILDRLISCSIEQSPTIAEQACELQLPSDEDVFQTGQHQQTSTLGQFLSGELNLASLEFKNQNTLLVVVSSIFGQCAQYALKEHKNPRQLPPWDSKSNFSKASSLLLKVEQIFCSSPSLVHVIENERAAVTQEVDYPRVGPLVYVHCLFHVSRCLLHHPFLMKQRLANLGEKQAPPLSFLQGTLELYTSAARALTELLEDVKEAGYIPTASFYGFFNTTAGVAHAIILAHSDEANAAEEARRHFRCCVRNLLELSRHWPHAALMVPVLEKALDISHCFRGFLDPSRLMSLELGQDEVAFLWETVDNTCLTTKKPQRLCNDASMVAGTGGGHSVSLSQELDISTFPSPLLGELADLGALINSGPLSPTPAQPLSNPTPTTLPQPVGGNAAHGLLGVGDILHSTSGPGGAEIDGGENLAKSSGVLMQVNSFINPEFGSWNVGPETSVGSPPSSSYHKLRGRQL